jgi:hypothetical protein
MMMQLGDPERALKGDDFRDRVDRRQVDHDRRAAARREPDLDHDSGRDLVTQYGHAGRHHGVGTPDCPRELHHHHDERCEPPGAVALADRRQRAREAFHDARAEAGLEFADGELDEAIETATRVQVTPEIVDAAYYALGNAAPAYFPPERHMRTAVAAALAAAGFEIEN